MIFYPNNIPFTFTLSLFLSPSFTFFQPLTLSLSPSSLLILFSSRYPLSFILQEFFFDLLRVCRLWFLVAWVYKKEEVFIYSFSILITKGFPQWGQMLFACPVVWSWFLIPKSISAGCTLRAPANFLTVVNVWFSPLMIRLKLIGDISRICARSFSWIPFSLHILFKFSVKFISIFFLIFRQM